MNTERTPERCYHKPAFDMRVDAVALSVSSQLPQGPHISEVEVAGVDTGMRIHFLHDEATEIKLSIPEQRSLQDGPVLTGYTFKNSGDGWDVYEELTRTAAQIESTTTPYKVQIGESHVRQLEDALAEQQFMCILTQDQEETKQSVMRRLLEKLRYVPLNISIATLGLSSTLELIVEEQTVAAQTILDDASADLNNYLNSVLADYDLAHTVHAQLATPVGATITVVRGPDGIVHAFDCCLPVEDGVSGDIRRGYHLELDKGTFQVHEWISRGDKGDSDYSERTFDPRGLDFVLACDLMLLLEDAEPLDQ